MKKIAMAVLGMVLLLTQIGYAAEAKVVAMSVENDRKVSLDYTLTVEGKVVDSSQGQAPLVYTHGKQEIIPGLENQLAGMKVGEEKTVTVSPKDAYGEINAQAVREVPRSQLPPDMKPEVGMTIGMRGPQGQQIPVKIKAMTAENVTIDLNHPLAGKTLEFKVKVVSIE